MTLELSLQLDYLVFVLFALLEKVIQLFFRGFGLDAAIVFSVGIFWFVTAASVAHISSCRFNYYY
jgi:hypothetical protein